MTIAAYLQELLNQESARLKNVKHEIRPHQFWEYSTLPERLKNILPGRDRFNAFNECLNALYDKGVRLTSLQMRLMNGMRMAACPRMFGDELNYNLAYLATFGITAIHSCLYCIFPRRGGKSTTQQVGIAAQVLTQPNGNYIALSLFARQGWEWLEQMRMYAMQLKEDDRFGFTALHDNRELFAIIPTASGTENTVKVYPGGSAGSYSNLRGIGARLSGLIVDECEFYPVRGLEVILPLIINGAFLIMMSSVGGVSARLGARRLLEARDEAGGLICLLLNWFKPCDECVRKGRAPKCRCNIQEPQSYQNHVDVAKVQSLMKALQTGAGDRELMNQEEEPNVTPLFMGRDLDILRDRSADVTFDRPIHKVYVGVDPGSHAHSQTAIVCVVRLGREYVVRAHVFFSLAYAVALSLSNKGAFYFLYITKQAYKEWGTKDTYSPT